MIRKLVNSWPPPSKEARKAPPDWLRLSKIQEKLLNLIEFQSLLAAPDLVRVIRRSPLPINPQEVLGAKACNPRLSHRPTYQKNQVIR
jgi:hypothetical protein